MSCFNFDWRIAPMVLKELHLHFLHWVINTLYSLDFDFPLVNFVGADSCFSWEFSLNFKHDA